MDKALIIIALLGVLILIVYAVVLIKQELLERKLYNLLYTKIDIEEYLHELGSLIATAKDNSRQKAKYTLYKASALLYKGEDDFAILALNDVRNFIRDCKAIEEKASLEKSTTGKTKIKVVNIAEIEKNYVIELFKILLELSYNAETENIYNEHKSTLDSLYKERDYKLDVMMIQALYKYRKGEINEALNDFKKIKNYNLNRLNKIMVRYYLALIYADLDRLIECEKEIEEIEDLKRKNKKHLFVYKKLDELVKEKRSNITNISGIDKDLEESMQQEALDKVNKEIESEFIKEFDKLKQEMAEKIEEEERVKEQETKND